jgi:hypothetical protein
MIPDPRFSKAQKIEAIVKRSRNVGVTYSKIALNNSMPMARKHMAI